MLIASVAALPLSNKEQFDTGSLVISLIDV